MMLVLTRKNHEKIRIGDDIVITVLRLKGNSVRLGIQAPDEVPVLRGELVFDVATDDRGASPAMQASGSGSNSGSKSDDRTYRPVKKPEIDDRWSGESNPRSDGDERKSAERLQNCFKRRVPREYRADIVTQLVDARGPLRAMLDRRSQIR